MAFDFQALLNDPLFSFGLSALGAANPRNAALGQVAQQLQGMQKQRTADAREKARMEQEKLQSELYGEQIKQARAKLAHEAQQEAQQAQFSQGIMKYLQGQGMSLGGISPAQADLPAPPSQPLPEMPGIGMPQEPAQPSIDAMPSAVQPRQAVPQPLMPGLPAQQPMQQPLSWLKLSQEQVTKAQDVYRNRILKQESGNRQFDAAGNTILGPMTRFGTKAVGRGQVMPATGPEAAALAGLPWDPAKLYKDGDYNAAIGEAYFMKQVQDFGEIPYAAAAYNAGPERVRQAIAVAEKAKRPELWPTFLPKETRDYVQNTTGVQPAPTPQAPPAPSSPLGLRNPGQPLIVAGALAQLQGMRGGAGLVELGKSMEPRTATPGSYQIDAAGNARQLPDPAAERKAALEERRFALEEQKMQREAQTQERIAGKATMEVNAQKAKDKSAYQSVTAAADRMARDTSELLKNPGLDLITGMTGGLISPRLLGENARNAAATFETLKSKILNDTLQSLKSASANGASGYGSLSESEGKIITNMISALDRSQSPAQIKKSLLEIQAYAQSLKDRANEIYSGTYGEEPPGQKGLSIPTAATPEQARIQSLPPNAIYVKTVKGKKVYQMPDGSMIKED